MTRLFDAWRQHKCWHRHRSSADQNERMAFQTGARHALSELIEHLAESDEATAVAMRLNDEIRDFATVAIKQEST